MSLIMLKLELKKIFNAVPTLHKLTEEEMAEKSKAFDYEINFDFYESLWDDTSFTIFYLPTRDPDIIYITEVA